MEPEEVGVAPGPQGSMDTLAASSRHPAPVAAPLERRVLAALTVEMDTLGSDLSRWVVVLPEPLELPFTVGEMGIISSSLFRMALEMDTLPLLASFSATRCTQVDVCRGRVCAQWSVHSGVHTTVQADRKAGR